MPIKMLNFIYTSHVKLTPRLLPKYFENLKHILKLFKMESHFLGMVGRFFTFISLNQFMNIWFFPCFNFTTILREKNQKKKYVKLLSTDSFFSSKVFHPHPQKINYWNQAFITDQYLKIRLKPEAYYDRSMDEITKISDS